MMCVKVCLHMFLLQINQINKINIVEVHPERQKRQKTRFVCNFNGKSVFRCTQRAITHCRVITLGLIFIKMLLNRAQGLKKKSQKVSARKNNNRQRYNKNVEGGERILPPALLGLSVLFHKPLILLSKPFKDHTDILLRYAYNQP